MHKIRLSLASRSDDFARLYTFKQGFHGDNAFLAFPADDSLTFFLNSTAEYALTIEGDAVLTRDEDISALPSMRFYCIDWSDETKHTGIGNAVLKLTHPDLPDEPSVYTLTAGEFRFTHSSPTLPDSAPVDDEGVRDMIMQEHAHAMFAGIVSTEHWRNFFSEAELGPLHSN